MQVSVVQIRPWAPSLLHNGLGFVRARSMAVHVVCKLSVGNVESYADEIFGVAIRIVHGSLERIFDPIASMSGAPELFFELYRP
jgi:hypothetical protein